VDSLAHFPDTGGTERLEPDELAEW
jgi:hypothetical protein